ncbi:AhpC/TSA family protein [Gluconacetobacter azotocaptans]|uniref:thioredoxin-dependent peroxiredoxin n=1 Tax=Gluconacetobacter azotocaptans TaxID=142834 RepID=A0A7W4PCS0_9PROT|nr:peroxiredoxin-like family protein [Gluconacetobacter azotocaptans]MBB2188983.1 AhpC/TSA family protein [Gluconacetobacter azotocaptans]MBM9401445.1 AhpC/TSA family protein [Gluconacetobacter azotocaptans]GBQ25832.1 alkyl hydroperoxide reductase [Gluconacetobacter azotocaptans DSM 13594]
MSTEQNVTGPSLRARFQALEDERRRSWAPDALAINANQRAQLVREHGNQPHVGVGDVLPAATLTRTDGQPAALDALVANGPAVLVFFRFANCPACNIALPYYRDTLWPALKDAQIPLVAISPQPIAALGEIATRHHLPFPVLSDTDLALSRALGLTYIFDAPSRDAAEAKGGTSEALNGTASWELPKPSVIVIGPGRVVRFADISPDWMDRTETPAILAALDSASHAASAKERHHAA